MQFVHVDHSTIYLQTLKFIEWQTVGSFFVIFHAQCIKLISTQENAH